MSEEWRKILIMKPSSLGDIVMALPALGALRKRYGEARISWLVRPEFAPLLKIHPYIEEVIVFDRKLLGKAWRNWAGLKELHSLIRELRTARFDAIIDLQGLFRTGALAWLSGCPRRFGMAESRELAHLFYTDSVPPDADKPHMVDYYLKIAAAAGASAGAAEFIFGQDRRAGEDTAGLLAGEGVSEGSYAVLIPGSAHPDKCWPVENFAAIADRIADEFRLRIVATGTASERDTVEKLCGLSRTDVVNLAGRTGLVELVEVLRKAALVVGNDTGPSHIAAALGRPAVLVYGCSNPARVGPYTTNASAVAIKPESRGREFKSADPAYDIAKIAVEQVYSKVRERLSD
jgi:heptosyltransferase-1